MKVYVVTTGAVFGLLTVAHVLRMIQEKPMAGQPWYVAITVATAALTVWAAWLVFRRSSRP